MLEILNESNEVDFRTYETCCSNEVGTRKRKFWFLEFYFYVYGKNNKYITSSIDDEYDKKSFTRLNREGLVDKSYLLTIMVCKNCGTYSIEIEEFEV